MKVTLDFARNDSAKYTHSGADQTIVCPNGIMARLDTENPSEIRDEIDVEDGDTVIFQKMESYMDNVVVPVGTSGTYLLFIFNSKNNFMVLHDFCYKDFYRYSGTKETFDTFYKDATGAYVYDTASASFIAYDAGTDTGKQRYSASQAYCRVQTFGETMPTPSLETGDILFADYTTGDGAIDININATVSVAGLKLNWTSDTNTQFQDTVTSFQLGSPSQTGSFDNDEIRFSGNRCVVSRKLQPDSRVAMAIRYKIMADFANNGYDDIEIHDINILTEMKLFEISGGEDA